MSSATAPLIVGFVADLMSASRIEQAAARLGYRVRWIESAEQLGSGATSTARPGEALHGQAAALTDMLTEWQPSLLVFDLGNHAVPWEEWIAKLKSSPATRRIPVLCFGPHVDSAAFQAARSAGADAAVARGRFVSALPELLQTHARVPDYAAARSACAEPLSAEGRRGIELFNQCAFYDAHHGLEAAWVADDGPGRDLYRAILQVAVAYYQIERGNYNGAIKMFLRVRQWLEPLPAVCRGVDVAALRADVARVHAAVLELGRERLGAFDPDLFGPVRLVDPPAA